MDSNIKTAAFTIVLNGMPFIKKQMEIIPKVFDHWYIIEGVALPNNCTSWCKLPSKNWINEHYCSTDGTFEFLNEIKLPNVSVIRKNQPWNGKIEMCNCFMPNISNSVLMQVDVDEIWNKKNLTNLLEISKINFNKFDSMKFKCNYFVGKKIKINTSNSYGDRPNEWVRLWTIQEPTFFLAHEPPILGKPNNKVIEKNETSKRGWVFDHYAYTTPEQVRFKEEYYGYKDALKKWQDLQSNLKFPVKASDFLPWIDENVDLIKI